MLYFGAPKKALFVEDLVYNGLNGLHSRPTVYQLFSYRVGGKSENVAVYTRVYTTYV